VPEVLLDCIDNLYSFATRGKKWKPEEETLSAKSSIGDHESLASLSSNLAILFPDERKRGDELWNELHDASLEQHQHALGAVLVSPKTRCRLCSQSLSIKASRISQVVVYDETKGIFLPSKIPKVCSRGGCKRALGTSLGPVLRSTKQKAWRNSAGGTVDEMGPLPCSDGFAMEPNLS